MGIPRGFCLRKNHRVGAMQVSKAAPRAEAQAKGQVTALNGLSPPQTSGRLSPVPPLRGALRAAPEPRGRSGVPSRPRPAPSSAAQDPRDGRAEEKKRGARAREGKEAPTPRAAPRARVSHRLATPGRRRTPERAWGRAQARLGLGGRPGGGSCAGTDLAFGFLV